MRTWGRQLVNGALTWVEVSTDANGFNDAVYLTTLYQVLLLNLNESPFYATYGIPQQQSLLQQVFPDYYVTLTQQTFAPYFTSLQITRRPGSTTPIYNVNVVTNYGAVVSATVKAQ